MILLAIIIISISIFLFLEGYYFMGILCLFGFSGSFGMIALIITSIFLIINGYWILGLVIILLIIWNIISLMIYDNINLRDLFK